MSRSARLLRRVLPGADSNLLIMARIDVRAVHGLFWD